MVGVYISGFAAERKGKMQIAAAASPLQPDGLSPILMTVLSRQLVRGEDAMNKHIAKDIMPHDLQARLVAASHGAVGPIQTDDILDLINFGFARDELVAIAGQSETVLMSVDAGEALTSNEYESLQRIMRFKSHAMRVFGENKKAALWMRTESKALAGTTPLQLLHSEAGAQIVEEQLFRIEHGIYV
jgi:putative toxin-antitoxin system antitoxin component (TIGR02293 family)